jgi:transcriptional regulator with GAF, ATPase, and Fis domain
MEVIVPLPPVTDKFNLLRKGDIRPSSGPALDKPPERPHHFFAGMTAAALSITLVLPAGSPVRLSQDRIFVIIGSPAKPIIRNSRAMQRVYDLSKRVAPTRSTALITGETGTGKEIIARFIHYQSPRRDKPMQVFNCHGVPATLLESELFGHERGAFTGAIQARSGLFERAHASTLLLDEVGDIPLAAQAKLLRILQERRFTRLGGTATYESDVRIIAATQRDLRAMVLRGKFREDLFYRLNVFPIHMPALRQRREDIAPLAVHLLEAGARLNRCRQSGFTQEALAVLISFHWPGNVRQLQAVIERALLLSAGEPIRLEHLPKEIGGAFVPPAEGETITSLAYAQRLLVARSLYENAWNFGKAAAELGVSTHVLRQLIAKLDLRRGR